MEILRNPDEKVICPYNASHHIRKTRMEVHLKKCRSSYANSHVLVTCDFNACHHVPEPELQYHHSTCPNKKEIELQIITQNNELPKVVTPLEPALPVSVDDSWDYCNVPSYNAEKYCIENQILRRLDTESSSKRRDFRNSERLRIGQLKSESDSSRCKSNSQRCQDREHLKNLPPIPVVPSPAKEKLPKEISDMLMWNVNNVSETTIIPK